MEFKLCYLSLYDIRLHKIFIVIFSLLHILHHYFLKIRRLQLDLIHVFFENFSQMRIHFAYLHHLSCVSFFIPSFGSFTPIYIAARPNDLINSALYLFSLTHIIVNCISCHCEINSMSFVHRWGDRASCQLVLRY
jgi:hypothetical protein